MDIPLRCECGTVTGFVETQGFAVRGACYCRDCQAFARFLGRPERMLDHAGGTEVVGTLPGRVHFTAGQDRLACIALTPRGPYRWYAECCRKAIGNTSRARKTPFVTLHVRALAAQPAELERAFGRSSFAFGADSATAAVAKRPAGLLLALPKIAWNILYARTSGAWRINPFFLPDSDMPLRAPQLLSKEERHSLRGDAAQS
jgi:hypothetical protein